ncbi:MAG: 17 kDa surface antigen [Polaromonas sp.]|nr:17 kDa surface antigen [Polaromonas sp.]
MKNTVIKTLVGSAMAAAALASAPASAMDILARVISSTPVVQQVAVPRQVCNNEAVIMQAPKSGAGALMGAIAGGAAGNAIGHGGGRAAATMIGLVGGAILGDRIEGPNNQLQNVQQCSTQTYYENRPSHFNVVYEYQGAQYNTQMVNDPGAYVRLQVTPVGAMPSSQAPQAYQPAPYPQPQTYYQPAPVQQPVYVQPVMAAPVVYPAYAPRPYYAPYYPPIGLSLNLGYSRGFGGGHHRGHWR